MNAFDWRDQPRTTTDTRHKYIGLEHLPSKTVNKLRFKNSKHESLAAAPSELRNKQKTCNTKDMP